MLPETSEYGRLNGYMVYGDENRNIASETFPDIYFPIHINQSKNSQHFPSYFKYIPFKKYHYYRESTVIKASEVIFSCYA